MSTVLRLPPYPLSVTYKVPNEAADYILVIEDVPEQTEIEEFQDDYDFLCNKLDEQLEQQQVEQARNFDEFVARVEETMQIVEGATRERAIEIIADAEGISEGEFDFYGLEILEYRFELKFGSISRWLSE